MPDNDIFRRYVPKTWRGATRCFHGDVEADEVAPMLLRAATRCLRESGGLPTSPEFVAIVQACLAGELSHAAAMRAAREAQQNEFHSRHAQLATRVVEKMISCPDEDRPLKGEVAKAFSENFVSELISHNVLDPRIVEIENLQRFATLADRYDRAERCRVAIEEDGRLPQLAQALLADPSCSRLRLPAIGRNASTSTAKILTFTVG